MAEQKNPQAQPELSLSEQTRIRREKLATLQAEGANPFAVTRFDWDATSQQIKDNFDAMEGKPVKVAGRLMSKRGMGKVSFCDLQDRDGRIQLYARQDEMDEEVYKKFKKFDIGDIAPMLIAHRASSFLAARRNRYMTSSHTHETISA